MRDPRYPTLPATLPIPDDAGLITTVVRVDLNEVIDRDLEEFLDLLSIRAVRNELLMGTAYDVTGLDGGILLLTVRGDITLAYEEYQSTDDQRVTHKLFTVTLELPVQAPDATAAARIAEAMYQERGSHWTVCVYEGDSARGEPTRIDLDDVSGDGDTT